MNAVVSAPELPTAVARRGITEPQWRTLANNLFPGAASESVLMVWDYCVARKLDPMKKPCHIVPMQVKDAKTGNYEWRDVVMPGIYEYRTTAQRTGEYMGHSTPDYGPAVTHLGVTVPEWCAITVYRWNKGAGQRVEYPVRVYFRECCGTRKDKNTGQPVLNQRWAVAPIQMMTKVCEAAGLREAFPDELGGEPTYEEMEDRIIEHAAAPQVERIDGPAIAHRMRQVMDRDLDEYDMADAVRAFEITNEQLNAAWSVLNSGERSAWTKFLKLERPNGN